MNKRGKGSPAYHCVTNERKKERNRERKMERESERVMEKGEGGREEGREMKNIPTKKTLNAGHVRKN